MDHAFYPDRFQVPARAEPSTEDIARLAYALWEARGGAHGSAEQDWHSAEELLRSGRHPHAMAAHAE